MNFNSQSYLPRQIRKTYYYFQFVFVLHYHQLIRQFISKQREEKTKTKNNIESLEAQTFWGCFCLDFVRCGCHKWARRGERKLLLHHRLPPLCSCLFYGSFFPRSQTRDQTLSAARLGSTYSSFWKNQCAEPMSAAARAAATFSGHFQSHYWLFYWYLLWLVA